MSQDEMRRRAEELARHLVMIPYDAGAIEILNFAAEISAEQRAEGAREMREAISNAVRSRYEKRVKDGPGSMPRAAPSRSHYLERVQGFNSALLVIQGDILSIQLPAESADDSVRVPSVVVQSDECTLLPMSDAPKDATEILIVVKDKYGNKGWLVAHYANGGGDEQPAFGPAWFYRTNFGFQEIVGTAIGWLQLPTNARKATVATNGGKA